MLFKNKELKKRINEAIKQIEEEERRKNLLLNQEVNYGYLQDLLNKVDNNPNLVIEIKLKSGDKITLRQQQNVTNPFNSFDGIPTEEEMLTVN